MTSGTAFALMLAYRPLLDPLPIADAWPWMLLPPVLAVAAVYKAIKLQDLRPLGREILRMSGQIVLFVVISAAALWLLTEWV